jgi:hypothetical protein
MQSKRHAATETYLWVAEGAHTEALYGKAAQMTTAVVF